MVPYNISTSTSVGFMTVSSMDTLSNGNIVIAFSIPGGTSGYALKMFMSSAPTTVANTIDLTPYAFQGSPIALIVLDGSTGALVSSGGFGVTTLASGASVSISAPTLTATASNAFALAWSQAVT